MLPPLPQAPMLATATGAEEDNVPTAMIRWIVATANQMKKKDVAPRMWKEGGWWRSGWLAYVIAAARRRCLGGNECR